MKILIHNYVVLHHSIIINKLSNFYCVIIRKTRSFNDYYAKFLFPYYIVSVHFYETKIVKLKHFDEINNKKQLLFLLVNTTRKYTDGNNALTLTFVVFSTPQSENT